MRVTRKIVGIEIKVIRKDIIVAKRMIIFIWLFIIQ